MRGPGSDCHAQAMAAPLPPRDWSHLDAAYRRIDPDDVPPGPLSTIVGVGLELGALGWLISTLLRGDADRAAWWEIALVAGFVLLFASLPLIIEANRRRFHREHPHYREWARDYARRGSPAA